ncbi:MAG: isoaspartyl peptidase/L-asparaginase [Pyrinomonadaceae bacterium]|nr:isoaspartyl peptidase/L-asparaginase [Pyrinomonadaceae bacterium]
MKREKSRRKFLGEAAISLGGAALAANLYSEARGQSAASSSKNQSGTASASFGFVLHGGAGTITKQNMTPELEASYQAKLKEALMTAHQILKDGRPGLDAIEAALRLLEDSPLFNAGKGAVLTSVGTVELDASIMEGATLKAGAVASLKHIKNPISLARLVMEKSPHVMMVSQGAEEFAKQLGIEMMPNEYFLTERRQKELQKKQEEEKKKQSHFFVQPVSDSFASTGEPEKYGTVGAVALDRAGNLAAGTSTGGTTNKRFGRVGDSPIIGAGTYANNRTCAVSCTGDGEYFIRSCVAHDISAMMEYRGISLKEAAQAVLDKVEKIGGKGGLIAIDRNGQMTMPFNTAGMYRGSIGADGKPFVAIYKD